MKDTNQSLKLLEQKFRRILPEPTLNELAVQHGFTRRKARRLTPFHFVLSLFLCLSKRLYSLRAWAIELRELCGGAPLSKQAVDGRLREGAARFSLGLLSYLLKAQSRVTGGCKQALSVFKRVLVQDSTTFSLQPGLQNDFKGNVSKGVQKAVLRLKVILDLLTMKVLQLGITSYAQNDQAAASNIHTLVRKGTLVIRDLGYWSIDSFRKIQGRGAYFLSRLSYKVALYGLKADPLPLSQLLRGKVVDRWVLLSTKHQLAVRLLVMPVPGQVVEQRIRKARRNRDRRVHYSSEYYHFLGYDVFVTNVAEQLATPTHLKELYGLRWQIELLFKGLKSGALHLKELVAQVRSNAQRVRTVVALALCFLLITLQRLYLPFTQNSEANKQTSLSFLKVLEWASTHLEQFFCLSQNQLQPTLEYYCCYEKRKRPNLTQKLHTLT